MEHNSKQKTLFTVCNVLYYTLIYNHGSKYKTAKTAEMFSLHVSLANDPFIYFA